MANNGKLFVFEGPDGSGKSTLARRVVAHLVSKGMPCEYASYPGHTPATLGKLVYELHHDPSRFELKSINATSLQLLHIAAHIDSVEESLKPTLKSGRSVVLDRFWWSTWVYGLFGGANRESIRKMLDIELEHWNGIRPECVFLTLGVEPGREKVSAKDFKRLADLYCELGCEERKNYRVEVVTGSPSLDSTFEKIVRVLDPISVSNKVGVDKR